MTARKGQPHAGDHFAYFKPHDKGDKRKRKVQPWTQVLSGVAMYEKVQKDEAEETLGVGQRQQHKVRLGLTTLFVVTS